MKRLYSVFFLLLSCGLIFVVPVTASDDPTCELSFSLADWKDNKPAAFVIYSDDSMVRSIKSQWTLENPDVPYDGFFKLGKTYNIPITFFVVPRLMDDAAKGDATHAYFSNFHPPSINPGAGGTWADWKFMHEQGHEIGSHSYSHTNFLPGPDGKPNSSVDPHLELRGAVHAIEHHIGEKPISMNFPYGSPVAEVLEVAHQYTPLTDEDISIDSVNVRKAVYGSDTETQDLIGEMKRAIEAGQCLIIGGHGIRTELGRHEEAAPDFNENGTRWDGYKPVEYSVMEGLFQYLDNNREQIYVDVFKNVSRYLAERKASILTVQSSEDGTILLEVTHNLDPELYDVPLTLKIDTQAAVSHISVYQDGKPVPVTTRNGLCLAQVVPNGGTVKVISQL